MASTQRKVLANEKENKRVSNFELPDAPEPKKKRVKGKKSDSGTCTPCPPKNTQLRKVPHSPAEVDNTGSDIELENDAEDNTLPSRNVRKYLVGLDDFDDSTLAEDLMELDAEDDVALRAMADPNDGDLLLFDWRGDSNNFEGIREKFTAPFGPTFEVTGLTPLEILKKIWDANIMDLIVRETNRYAHQMQLKNASKTNSRMSRWIDTTAEEIWRFFAIIMLQSLVVNNVEREYWYPKIEQLRIGDFRKIMSFNRFLLLKRCLHFVDNTTLPKKPSKLDKVMPIITHLNKNFSTIYLPEQNVSIDESLPWKCRRKQTKAGIKSFVLCESRTGYLWRMEVSLGKGRKERPQEANKVQEMGNEPKGAISNIVFNLMRPLFGKGHTLVMDSFYNAPLLSRILKAKYKTDTMGTLRLDREFVPESLRSINKKDLKPGEVSFSTTKDLSLIVWKDSNVPAMISTFHKPEVDGKEKHGYYKFKPKVVLDYNLCMGVIDRKDQMLHGFPVERMRNCSWYKNFFRRLLNVSIHNALVIYNHERKPKTQLQNREFRVQLIQEMLKMYSPQALNKIETPKPPPSPSVSQMHLPAKNKRMQRCKLCYQAKVRRTTAWRCSICDVNLCLVGCYKDYHLKYVCQEGSPTGGRSLISERLPG